MSWRPRALAREAWLNVVTSPWRTSGLVLAATFAAGLIGTGVQLRLADNP